MNLPASVLFLTALALLLRLIGLNSQLWYDEIWTVVLSVRQPVQVALTTLPVQNHTLYSVLAKGLVALLGEEPWVLRAWAVLFGVLSVPMLYVLGRVITERREALAAATLLAVSYHHIWFSQNARGYTGLLLATLAATWLFLIGLKRGAWRPWLVYALVGALGAYMHLTMVLVVLSHALVLALLIADRRRRPSPDALRRAAGGIVLAGALTLALYAPLAEGAVDHLVLARPSSVYANPGAALAYALHGLRVGYGWVGIALGAALAIVGAWRYMRQDYPVLLLLILPGLLGLSFMIALENAIHPRYFFYAAGLALLVLTRGVGTFATWLSSFTPPGVRARAATLLFAAFVAVGVLVSALSYRHLYTIPKQDYLAALALLRTAPEPGDVVTTVGPTWHIYLQYYGVPWIRIEGADELAEVVARPGRTWAVYAFESALFFENPDLARMLPRRFVSVRTFPGTQADGDVHVLVEAESGGQRLP